MTDDLVKRLTIKAGVMEMGEKIDWGSDTSLMREAAARIEELEQKLARAAKALERIASGEFSGRMLTSMPPQDAAQYFARTALAELEGEIDD
jgi:transposase